MAGNIDALIFDLDGTLLNSLEDLADAANAALLARGYPAHPVDAYRYFVGEGMRTMMSRAAPKDADSDAVAALVEGLRGEYARNWAARTRPYPGITAMLRGLAGLGLPFAVLSNKPDGFTRLIVRHFFPDIDFAAVQGSPEGGKAKPDPAMALALAETFGVLPGRVLIVGDSFVDMDTASAAGMIPAGALWGFRPESELRKHGAKHLLRTPEEVFSCL